MQPEVQNLIMAVVGNDGNDKQRLAGSSFTEGPSGRRLVPAAVYGSRGAHGDKRTASGNLPAQWRTSGPTSPAATSRTRLDVR